MSSKPSEILKSLTTEDLHDVPYPLAILGVVGEGGSLFGCTLAWVTQIAYEPTQFMIAVGHKRKTCEQLKLSLGKKISINYVPDSAEGISVATLFGRTSCRVHNKWELVPHSRVSDVPVLLGSPLIVIGTITGLTSEGSHLVARVLVDKVMGTEGSLKKGILTYDYGAI